MELKDVVLRKEKQPIATFLKRFNLTLEDDVDKTLALYDGQRLIATASATKNIIKCVAIDPEYQHQNHLNFLMSKLIKQLSEDHRHLFVYTMPEHVAIFKSLGFKEIVQTMNLSFMELFGDIKASLKALRDNYDLDKSQKASVVINANPLTNGHLHLIKTAASASKHLIVFVVSEDRSFFSFEDRFNIIKAALRSYENITVLPTMDYLVSYATFPKYFMKREQTIKEEHALIDVLTFKQHYMKIFNINARFVGEEPYSPTTNTYNQTMKHYLGDALKIIERKTVDEQPISASTVRRLLKQNGLKAIERYVPKSTLDYLNSPEGQRIIKELKDYDRRH